MKSYIFRNYLETIKSFGVLTELIKRKKKICFIFQDLFRDNIKFNKLYNLSKCQTIICDSHTFCECVQSNWTLFAQVVSCLS